MNIKWDCTRKDAVLIDKIADRAMEMAKKFNMRPAKNTFVMDLTACHLNDAPLDLKRLLKFPDFDFSHDVWGINKHMDQTTGKLKDCFVPRCHAKGKRRAHA